jgi:hypothetical protein
VALLKRALQMHYPIYPSSREEEIIFENISLFIRKNAQHPGKRGGKNAA